MNEVISDATVKTRKNHICLGCLQSFPPGSIMHKQTNIFEGSIGSVYTCPACEELKKYIDPEDGWWMEGYTHDAIEGTDESPESYLEKLRSTSAQDAWREKP